MNGKLMNIFRHYCRLKSFLCRRRARLLALEMTVKRLNHLGINACVVGAVNEPIGPKDILVVGSGSGESIFPKHITACAKRYDAKLFI